MKYSQFNSVVPYNDKFLLYNSFSSNYLVLMPMLKDLLEAASAEGVDQLEKVHPLFYQALASGKYLVDDTENELENVKRISKAIDSDDGVYQLTINPTMNCNFKCWYCYETHVKGSRMSQDIIARTNMFITSTAESPSLKQFALAWFGGEPLLYFEDIVLPIMQHFTETCTAKNIVGSIGFTTNGYLITEKMASTFAKYPVTHLQITLDGSEEDHDMIRYVSKSRGSYREIIQNIKLLLQHGIRVTTRVNYTTKNIGKCIGILDDIQDIPVEEREHLVIDFHRVWQDKEEDEFNTAKSVINTFQRAGFRVNSHYSPDNVRHSCYADKKNSATLNYNGDIFKCTARDFTTSGREGYIAEDGTIVWENDSLNRRLDAKFNNKPCLTCRILPLCNGGCSQHALENLGKGDYCVHAFDEREKDKIIVSKFEQMMAS